MLPDTSSDLKVKHFAFHLLFSWLIQTFDSIGHSKFLQQWELLKILSIWAQWANSNKYQKVQQIFALPIVQLQRNLWIHITEEDFSWYTGTSSSTSSNSSATSESSEVLSPSSSKDCCSVMQEVKGGPLYTSNHMSVLYLTSKSECSESVSSKDIKSSLRLTPLWT